jgi:hypothetical protein
MDPFGVHGFDSGFLQVTTGAVRPPGTGSRKLHIVGKFVF